MQPTALASQGRHLTLIKGEEGRKPSSPRFEGLEWVGAEAAGNSQEGCEGENPPISAILMPIVELPKVAGKVAEAVAISPPLSPPGLAWGLDA